MSDKVFRFDCNNLTEIRAGFSEATIEVAPAHILNDQTQPSAHNDIVCLTMRHDDSELFSAVGLTPDAADQIAAALVAAAARVRGPAAC